MQPQVRSAFLDLITCIEDISELVDPSNIATDIGSILLQSRVEAGESLKRHDNVSQLVDKTFNIFEAN
jgi:hypothetical protein